MKKYHSILAVIILIGALWAASFFYPDVATKYNAKFVFGVIFLLVGPLLIYIRFIILKNNKNDDYRDWMKEFEYLRHNTLTGVLIGIGVASVLVGIGAIVYQPEKNVFHEKIFEILTLYITTITSFVVIRTIFEKAAPITNVESLLLRICDDIYELLKKEQGELLIIYPALIIGYYRERTNKVLQNHYDKYSSAIHSVAEDPSITATIITYDTKYYQPLFDKYVEMNTENYVDTNPEMKKAKDEEVKDCVDEALRRFNDFKDASHRKCKTYGIEPGDLKEHFVLVGDVVYTITSFGLPINEKDGSGNVVFQKPPFIDGTEKLVKLYAVRQQDKELVDLIKKKIKIGLPTS